MPMPWPCGGLASQGHTPGGIPHTTQACHSGPPSRVCVGGGQQPCRFLQKPCPRAHVLQAQAGQGPWIWLPLRFTVWRGKWGPCDVGPGVRSLGSRGPDGWEGGELGALSPRWPWSLSTCPLPGASGSGVASRLGGQVLGRRSTSCHLLGAARPGEGGPPLASTPILGSAGSGCKSLGCPPDPVSVRSENRDKTK